MCREKSDGQGRGGGKRKMEPEEGWIYGWMDETEERKDEEESRGKQIETANLEKRKGMPAIVD